MIDVSKMTILKYKSSFAGKKKTPLAVRFSLYYYGLLLQKVLFGFGSVCAEG